MAKRITTIVELLVDNDTFDERYIVASDWPNELTTLASRISADIEGLLDSSPGSPFRTAKVLGQPEVIDIDERGRTLKS